MKRKASVSPNQAKLARLERAKRILEKGKLIPIFVSGAEEEQLFVCFSQQKDGKVAYLVDLREKTCTCPDHAHNAPDGWCKHLMAAWLQVHHPQNWKDWLPEWARNGNGNGQAKGQDKGNGKLEEALAEIPDDVLAKLIHLLHVEQMERDRKGVKVGAGA